MIYFIVNQNNEVTAKLTGHKSGGMSGMLKVEDCVFSIGDIYDPETQTFSTNPKTAIKAQIIEIDAQLNSIDLKLIRCLDEIQSGEDITGEAAEQKTKLKAQKNELRLQRKTLEDILKG